MALVALAGAATPAFLVATESMPEVTSRGRAYFLPVSPARLVYRFGDEAPPEVLEFWQAHGREWQIYWDYRLGTPHALYPLTPESIVAAPLVAATEGQGNGGSADLVKAVRQWIDGLSGFLGVDSSRLGEPFVDSMGKLVMVVFPQTTPSGIPIRGANVRVLLNRQGNLASLRAFVARGVDDPPGEVLSAEAIAERTTARGSAVEASRLEMAFPTEEVSSALPIWSVDAIDPPPPGMDMPSSSEHIVDAYSGALLARTVVMKRFDGDGGGEEVRKVPVTGKVLAAAPDLSSIFLSPFDGGPRVDNVLRGALVRDTFQSAGQDAQHRPTATTDEDGKFAGVELNPPATLDLHAALEYGHFVKKNDPSTYVRVFEISPYGFPTHIDPLPGETNLVGGFLPHLTQSHAPEEPYEFRWNATSQPTDAVSIERVHWLMAYEAA
ncbi:MAG TPA: hypothetical protein VFD71_17660, partial [Planctomycetota bacterium]|nr:hypothetical protein [Planctomycetota bacterium]